MEKTGSIQNSSRLIIFLLIIVLGLTLRIFSPAGGRWMIESDEAIVGLMARHILEGERPVFYYGQTYMGSFEAYLTAVVFNFLGSSPANLKLVPLLFSIIFIALTYVLARQMFGEEIALMSMLLVAVSPAFLTQWSLKARGGYIETLVFGNLILILACSRDILSPPDFCQEQSWSSPFRGEGWVRGRLLRLFALGFISGFAWWTNQLIVYYLTAVFIYLILTRNGREGLFKRIVDRNTRIWIPPGVVVLLFSFLLGSAPLWLYHLFNSCEKMIGFAGVLNFPTYLRKFFISGMPVILGIKGPWNYRSWLSWPYAMTILVYIFSVVYFIYIVLRGVIQKEILPLRFTQRQNDIQRRVTKLFGTTVVAKLALLFSRARFAVIQSLRCHASSSWILLLLLFSIPLIFSISEFGWFTSEPRYILPIYSVLPILVSVFIRRVRKVSKFLSTGILFLILFVNMYGNLKADIYEMCPLVKGERVLVSHEELINFLRSEGLNRCYADYWIAYRLTFETNEDIICAPLENDRYPRYTDMVRKAPNPAYVLTGSQSNSFEKMLSEMKADYNRKILRRYVVYYSISPRVNTQ